MAKKNENDVVRLTIARLQGMGFAIQNSCTTSQRGIDIVAFKGDSSAFVEAKGETSSRIGSPRYAPGFSTSQLFDRAAKGIFTCLQLRQEHPERTAQVILALPHNTTLQTYIASVQSQLTMCRIEVWWV